MAERDYELSNAAEKYSHQQQGPFSRFDLRQAFRAGAAFECVRSRQSKDSTADHVTFPTIRDGKNVWVCSGCDLTWNDIDSAIKHANDHPPAR